MHEAKANVTSDMMTQPSSHLTTGGPSIETSIGGLGEANEHLQGSVNRLIYYCTQLDGQEAPNTDADGPLDIASGARHLLGDRVQETQRLAQQIDHLLGRLGESLG